MKYIIIVGVVLIVIIVLVLITVSKKKEDIVPTKIEEDNNLNAADVNMMQGINEHGFASKGVSSSRIPIPDFKKNEPIGYKDTSHVLNNTGDAIAKDANNSNN